MFCTLCCYDTPNDEAFLFSEHCDRPLGIFFRDEGEHAQPHVEHMEHFFTVNVPFVLDECEDGEYRPPPPVMCANPRRSIPAARSARTCGKYER